MEELLQELIEYAGDDYCEEQKSFMFMMIQDAIDEVANEMYPYGFSSEIEEKSIKDKTIRKYRSKIRKIAQYHYDKQGREGVTGWSESGMNISYETSGTPPSYLRGIVPVAKII